MNASLSATQVAVLALYAAGMTAGQVLFKLAALRLAPHEALAERALGLLQSWQFALALALYLALSLLWVWILTFTPLSRAYPFVALAFAITPLVGGMLFAEPLTLRLVGGIVVILVGLVLVAG